MSISSAVFLKQNRPIYYLILFNVILALSAFVKDIFMAQYFGTTVEADAFTLGFFLPDTIGNNLIATGLGVTCIPIFSRLLAHERHSLLKVVFQRLLMLTLSASLLLAILLYVFAEPILSVLVKGHQSSFFLMVSLNYMLMVPMILFFPVIMVFSALFQSKRQFIVPAISPILFNIIWLVGLVCCMLMKIDLRHGQFYLSAWLTAAAGFCVVYFLPFIKKFWIDTHTDGRRKTRVTPYLFLLFHQFLPYVMTLLFSQGLLVVERYLASGLATGTVAALNYSYRLVQFPVWVVVAAISTVLLPSFSRDMSIHQHDKAHRQMRQALVLVCLISIVASFGLFLLRVPILSILFEHGAFDEESVSQTAHLLSGYAWAILGQSITFLSLRYFTARNRLGFPLLISGLSFLVSVVFDFTAVPVLGASALGYGAAAGAFVSGILFLLILKREMGGFYGGQREKTSFFDPDSGL